MMRCIKTRLVRLRNIMTEFMDNKSDVRLRNSKINQLANKPTI